jgi:hypothetical protein
MRKKYLIALAALVLAATGFWAIAASAGDGDVGAAREATAKFQSLDVAKGAGYGLFRDVNGIACIAMPGLGAMGIHFVNGALVGDPGLDPRRPEALVYAPQAGGLKLAALEYIVVKSAWDARHSSPPRMFGQPFNLTLSPNRYGLPDFYSLHAWLFKNNPAGMFMPWNPDVKCGDG